MSVCAAMTKACKQRCSNQYEVLANDEINAIESFREEARGRRVNVFFTVNVLVEAEDGLLDQRISVVGSVSKEFMNKLGFSTSVFKHVFDGVSWRSNMIYTSYNRSVSNRLVLMSGKEFAEYLNTLPKNVRAYVLEGRKNARRLLHV